MPIMQPHKIKPRKCKVCKTKFLPVYGTLQAVCSAGCAAKEARRISVELEKERQKLRKEKVKTHKDYLRLLQDVFNRYIRTRDSDLPCISCGRSMIGKKGDASHYFSVGSTPELRFDEDNVHLACVNCNQWKSGNLIEYGARLPERIGQKRFEQLLERRGKESKLTIPEIADKMLYYKELIKKLRNDKAA